MSWLSDRIGSDPIGSIAGGVNSAMNFVGLGNGSAFNDFLADSPIGSYLGMSQNKEAKRQFDEQMKWEKYKFNNAHQAEVADLEKAGLNPILSYGGSGATSGSLSPTAHMDNGSAGLNFITGILSNVANLKNAKAAQTTANAVEKKANAESEFIDMQKRILGYSESYSKYKGENFAKYVQMELNKDPRNTIKAIVYGIGDMINDFSNSSTGKQVERTGEKLFNISQVFEDKQVKRVLDTINLPGRSVKILSNLLKLIRVLTVDDSLKDVPIKEFLW